MRCWLPECVYRPFPYVVASIGVIGSFGCTAPCMALGGMLLLYGCGVVCMRR